MIEKQQKIILGLLIGISSIATHASWKNYIGLSALASATLYAGYKAIIIHNTQRIAEQAILPIISAVAQNNVITESQKEALNNVKPLAGFQDSPIWIEKQKTQSGARIFSVYDNLNDLIANYNQGEKIGSPRLSQELASLPKPIQVKKYWTICIAASLCAASAYVANRINVFKK